MSAGENTVGRVGAGQQWRGLGGRLRRCSAGFSVSRHRRDVEHAVEGRSMGRYGHTRLRAVPLQCGSEDVPAERYCPPDPFAYSGQPSYQLDLVIRIVPRIATRSDSIDKTDAAMVGGYRRQRGNKSAYTTETCQRMSVDPASTCRKPYPVPTHAYGWYPGTRDGFAWEPLRPGTLLSSHARRRLLVLMRARQGRPRMHCSFAKMGGGSSSRDGACRSHRCSLARMAPTRARGTNGKSTYLHLGSY